jgi:predicted RND superfamily exporter protein
MTQGKWIVVVGAYLLIGLGSFLGTQLHVDLSLTTLSSRESADYKNYQEYAKQFPVHDSVLMIVVASEKKFKSRADFQRIDKLSRALAELNGVSNLTSITSLLLPERTLFGSRDRTFLPVNSEILFKLKHDKLDEYPDITPKLLSADRTAARLYIDVDWNIVSIDQLRNVIAEYTFDEVHLSGTEIYKSDAAKSLSRELFVLPCIAIVLLLLLFFIWFQELRSLFVIIAVLGLNIALVNCVFWLTGINIGTLTVTVPLLIIVLSFCDIVHVIHRFKQQDVSVPIETRIIATTRPLRISLWLTSLTTFSAFAMFFVSGVDEIIEFAIVTCTGIVIAYLTARFILPVFIVAFRLKPFKRKIAFSRIQAGLIHIQRRYKRIVVASMVLIAICTWGALQYSKINTSFRQHIGANTAMGSSMRFIDDHFDGVRTIEVIVKSENVLTPSTIQLVDTIEKFLLKEYRCRSVFSANSAIKRLNRFNRFGGTEFYTLPDSLNDESFKKLVEFGDKLGLINAMTADKRLLRIVGYLPDVGSAEASKRNRELDAFIHRIEPKNAKIFISGFSYVRDRSTERVTYLILLGIALSLLIAGLIAGFIFRSWKIGLITIVPNLFPLLAALVFIELLGVGLNASSVMALSIILGLSLDDTIYFLGSIYKKGKKKITPSDIENSLKENAFPALVTSLILSVGFAVLAFSEVQSNRNIGILVATILLFALISDLVIFPALLGLITRSKRV